MDKIDARTVTLKERAYEILLKDIEAMCDNNQHVEFGSEEANKEFKAISTQIMWGMWEQAEKENALEKIRSLWDTCGEKPIYRNGIRSLRSKA